MLLLFTASEFDDFVNAGKKFSEDLFDGTLLSDTSQADKDNIDKVIPTVEELEKMVSAKNESSSYSFYKYMSLPSPLPLFISLSLLNPSPLSVTDTYPRPPFLAPPIRHGRRRS